MKSFFMHYGMIIVAGSLTVLGLMFSTPFAEAVTGSIANFTTGFTKKNVENIDRVTIGLGNGGAGGSGGSEGSGGSGESSTVSVTKGQIVTLSQLGLTDVDANSDSTTDTFRILSVNGSQVKLLGMDSYRSAFFAYSGGSNYSGSNLNITMTNYYNALPSDVQSAIVAQNIVQSKYSCSWSIPMTTSNRTGQNIVGERYVYSLDVDDVIEYLGENYTALALNQMFFGDDAGKNISHDVWLRSAYAGNEYDAFYVSGEYGYVHYARIGNHYYEVRPAFVLDLG